MSDKLCGLAGLGLDNLEDMDIFGQEKKEEQAAAEAPKIEEKDLIYDKNFTCPVCGEDFPAKIMKTGKARLLGTDQDLRAKYEGIDAVKYDVILCPHCGYAALNRYFNNITKVYAKLIKENISSKVQLHTYDDDIYTYEEAIERYKLCLANAVVKRAHASEKAYICLKSGWLRNEFFELIEENISKVNHYFKTVFRTFRKHKQYIKNALETHYSNAKLEGTNKLIKDIKRLGFGFRNFINFRKRVFITLNIQKEKTYQVLSRC